MEAMTITDYETKLEELRQKWRKTSDPTAKKIIEIRGKLLLTGYQKLKQRLDLTIPLTSDEMYETSLALFGQQ